MDKVTPIPNVIFDHHLSNLRPSETQVLLTIFRQTIGWKDHVTGGRKKKDWITSSQFQRKTGLSDKTITNAIDGLVAKGHIKVTDENNYVLYTPSQRRGKPKLFYEPILNFG